MAAGSTNLPYSLSPLLLSTGPGKGEYSFRSFGLFTRARSGLSINTGTPKRETGNREQSAQKLKDRERRF